MHQSVVSGFSGLAAVTAVLSFALTYVLALPTLPLSLDSSSLQQNASSLLVPPNPRPPQEPTCPPTEQWGVTIGHPSYDDCDYILSNLYPKDPLLKPVMRNFYVAFADVSHTMSNFRLPYDESYGKQLSHRRSKMSGTLFALTLQKEHATSRCFSLQISPMSRTTRPPGMISEALRGQYSGLAFAGRD